MTLPARVRAVPTARTDIGAEESARGAVGARFYSRVGLAIYDVGVLGFYNHVLWRCPTGRLLQHYSRHVSGNHLEAGVGTGWFLDHCRFPVPNPRIGLIDLNESALEKTSARLSRYGPESHQADLLDPVPGVTAPFDSLGMCYLLHCLPVAADEKCQVVHNLRALLNPGAVVFGATILGDDGAHWAMGRAMMWGLNRTGVFNNGDDTAEILEMGLGEHLDDVNIEIVGAAALFSGLVPATDRLA